MGVFISYTWESDEHKLWVRNLAARLRIDGIESILDQWEVGPGDKLAKFMESSIRENEYTLIICTPEYKRKADHRLEGAGCETEITTAEIMHLNVRGKFIPILRHGEWADAAPSYLLGTFFVDLREGEKYEEEYKKLLDTLQGTRPKAPPVGKSPHKKYDELKLNFILDRLTGHALSTSRGIVYKDGILIKEEDIVFILSELKKYADYTGKEYWLTILHRSGIEAEIDGHLWKNGDQIYTYDESERWEIINRCAKRIHLRLNKYAGADHIQYKVGSSGDIGFRYI